MAGSRIVLGAIAAFAAAAAIIAPAHASFPGRDGKIAVFDRGILFLVNEDGSGARFLVDKSRRPLLDPRSVPVASGRAAAFSFAPGGRRVAYVCTPPHAVVSEICTVNVDGTARRVVTHPPRTVLAGDTAPVWSPDGKRIAFTRQLRRGSGSATYVYVIAADGSGLTHITAAGSGCTLSDGSTTAANPAWSSKGAIAFVCIGATEASSGLFVAADATQRARRVDCAAGASPSVSYPSFSPDGSRIALQEETRADPYSPSVDRVVAIDPAAADCDPRGLLAGPLGPPWGRVVWSPDGRRIAFVGSATAGRPLDGFSGNTLFVATADGTGAHAIYRSLYARPEPPGALATTYLDWQCLGACRAP